MTRNEYIKCSSDLYNSGKISEDTYDAMMLNIDCFVEDEEIWEAIDAYGNHYEFDNQEDAYNFCYNYIKEAYFCQFLVLKLIKQRYIINKKSRYL